MENPNGRNCIKKLFHTHTESTIMKPYKSFASDNHAGTHPTIMQALNDANHGHAHAYGNDEYTKKATELCKQHFGAHADVYFVFNGTGANVVGLSAMLNSYNAIICAESAHIHTSECGATENFTGSKMLLVPTTDGKLTIDGIKKHMLGVGNQHTVQPKVISITQATELGTVYTPQEIKAIADFAHANDMFLHLDGARLANAAAYLNVSLRALTTDAGVDVCSFGGTKNGMMFGEAVVFCNPTLGKNAKYIRDQTTQLASKMRFISAQFIAMLSDDLWLKNAQHANTMAQLLADELCKIKGITLSQPVQINSIFPLIPPQYIAQLQEHSFFHIWNTEKSVARLMTSWATTEQEINDFVEYAKEIVR